jgi:hypothetical protein
MDHKKPKRPAPISYRPPKALCDEFMTRAQNSGLSTSAFITASVFGKVPPRSVRTVPLEKQAGAALLAQAASINDRLRKIIEGVDDLPSLTLLEQCQAELSGIRSCLLAALGRRP